MAKTKPSTPDDSGTPDVQQADVPARTLLNADSTVPSDPVVSPPVMYIVNGKVVDANGAEIAGWSVVDGQVVQSDG